MGVKDTANLAMIPAAYAEDKVYSVLPSDGDGDFTFTRSGNGTRINKGGLIETLGSNVPRLNYRLDDDGNPSDCPELLMEPTRLNKIINSGDLSNASFTKAFVTTTANQAIAPDGTLTAAKLVSTSSSQARVYESVSTFGTIAIASVFVKLVPNGGQRFVSLSQFGASGSPTAIFDLKTGGVTGTSNVSDYGIQKYPNDWWRIFIKYSCSSGDSSHSIKLVMTENPTSYSVTTIGGEIYAWGFQLTDGSYGGYLTSYIPTGSSFVTRNADSCYLDPFSDLASDYPITIYCKLRVVATSNSQFIFSIQGGSTEYLTFKTFGTSAFHVSRRDTAADDIDTINFDHFTGSVMKVALRFKSNTSYDLYVNGTEIFDQPSGTDIEYAFTKVFIGLLRIVSDTNHRNPIDEFFIWNKNLTDAEMVEVTSYDSFREMAKQQTFKIK